MQRANPGFFQTRDAGSIPATRSTFSNDLRNGAALRIYPDKHQISAL